MSQASNVQHGRWWTRKKGGQVSSPLIVGQFSPGGDSSSRPAVRLEEGSLSTKAPRTSGQNSCKPNHVAPIVFRRDMVSFEPKLLKETERRRVPTAYRRPEPPPPSCDRGVEHRAGRLSRIAASVCPLKQLVGDLGLIDRRAADDQSAIFDEIALKAAGDGKQRDPGLCCRSELGGDSFPDVRHAWYPIAPFRDESSVFVDIGLVPRPQRQPLRAEVERHRLIIRHRASVSMSLNHRLLAELGARSRKVLRSGPKTHPLFVGVLSSGPERRSRLELASAHRWWDATRAGDVRTRGYGIVAARPWPDRSTGAHTQNDGTSGDVCEGR